MIEQRVFHPSPRYGVQLVIGILFIFWVCFAPFALLALAPEIGVRFLYWYLLANAIWIAIALALVKPYVRSIAYELGDRELIVRRGIITKAVDLVPYHMVTNVALRRGPVARALGLGALRIHTAGYSQNSNAEATIAGVPNYDELREAILTAMRAAKERAVESAPASRNETLDALLAEVRGLRADLKH